MTTVHWKLVVDCADPHAQAAFWAAALGYTVEDHSALIENLLTAGAITPDLVTEAGGRPAWRTLAGVRHPDEPFDPVSGTGLGRRLLFQAVPEAKTVKNRLHLDLHPGPDARDAMVEKLTALGATVQQHVEQPGGEHTVMADPEGNEFCVQ
ncbi:hypothetical protein OH807_23365 [Kitasatospora sp. NBC_01560]|uniref:VOC family protein n=1 Tax=Kitasatospora sp. NBC_01560 TaxID=2975965 RepID=UPI00386937A5